MEAGVVLNDFSGVLLAHLRECRSQMLYYVLLMLMPVQRNTRSVRQFPKRFSLAMTNIINFIDVEQPHESVPSCIGRASLCGIVWNFYTGRLAEHYRALCLVSSNITC